MDLNKILSSLPRKIYMIRFVYDPIYRRTPRRPIFTLEYGHDLSIVFMRPLYYVQIIIGL